MFIDHLAGASVLDALTARGHLLTSAAEGFVFISGFLASVVYRRLAASNGQRVLWWRMLRRAALLYLVSVLLTVLVVPIGEHFGAGPCRGCSAVGVRLDEPLQFVGAVASLQLTYYLVDIPLLYTRLMIVAPIALVLLTHNWTWLLVTMSVATSTANLLMPGGIHIGWRIENNGTFHLAAWQHMLRG